MIGEKPGTTNAVESVIDCDRYASGGITGTLDFAVS
jgi:hypothetical protein